jgi:hypothetical protein
MQTGWPTWPPPSPLLWACAVQVSHQRRWKNLCPPLATACHRPLEPCAASRPVGPHRPTSTPLFKLTPSFAPRFSPPRVSSNPPPWSNKSAIAKPPPPTPPGRVVFDQLFFELVLVSHPSVVCGAIGADLHCRCSPEHHGAATGEPCPPLSLPGGLPRCCSSSR